MIFLLIYNLQWYIIWHLYQSLIIQKVTNCSPIFKNPPHIIICSSKNYKYFLLAIELRQHLYSHETPASSNRSQLCPKLDLQQPGHYIRFLLLQWILKNAFFMRRLVAYIHKSCMSVCLSVCFVISSYTFF